jgi:hypothetical protein
MRAVKGCTKELFKRESAKPLSLDLLEFSCIIKEINNPPRKGGKICL